MTPSMTARPTSYEPPSPQSARPFVSPPLYRSRLAGGLNLVLVEHTVVPLAYLHCVVPAGAQYEPTGMEGIASLFMPLLREGTARRDATQISAAVEALGADILTRVDWEHSSLTVELLAEDLDFGVDLLLELISSPSFPAPSIERLKRRQLARLKQQYCQPAELANLWFARAVYGSRLYGRPLLGSESSLSNIGREDLAIFHHARCGLDGAVIIAIGDFKVEALARRIEAALATAVDERRPVALSVEPDDAAVCQTCLIDLPEAKQVELRIGHASVPQQHPDFPGLQLLNKALGNRLKLSLRERLGYAYYVSSRFTARNGHGPFVVATAVSHDNAGAATRAIMHELEALQQEPISGLELADAQRQLRGGFLRSFQSAYEMAIRLKHLAANNLPSDYYRGYLEEISRLTANDLLALARRHLFPQQLTVTAVGRAAELREQFFGCEQVSEINSLEP